MFDNTFITDTQPHTFGTPEVATKKKTSDQQLPTGKLKVPGFPDAEACYWVAPTGSKNAGAIYAGVFRVGEDQKGNRKVYRTFPLRSGGLFANLLGTCELLNFFSDDLTISEADRRLYYQVSLEITAALVKHLSPGARRKQGRQAAAASFPNGNDETADAKSDY